MDTTSQESSVPAGPFDYLNIRFRMHPRRIKNLRNLGVRLVDRTDERQDEIIEGHKAHRGLKYYFRNGERINAAGEILGGSGICRIEFNKPVREVKTITDPDGTEKEEVTWIADETLAMTLKDVGYDLARNNYVLTDVYILRLPGEQKGMGFLVLSFTPGNESMMMALHPEVSVIIDGLVDGWWRSVFVYVNPFTRSATVNANHIVKGRDLDGVTDHRNLRLLEINEKGRSRWRSEEVNAPTAQAA